MIGSIFVSRFGILFFGNYISPFRSPVPFLQIGPQYRWFDQHWKVVFSSCRDRAALQKDDTSLLVTSSKRRTAVCLFFLRENFLREKCLSLLSGSPNLVPLQLAACRYDCDVDSHDLTLLYPMSPRSLLSSFQLGFFRSRISAAIFNAIFFSLPLVTLAVFSRRLAKGADAAC